MKNVADQDTEVKGTDIMEKDTTKAGTMDQNTIEEVNMDAAVEAATEDVHADIISARADSPTDGESSSPRKRRSKS